MTTSSIRPHPVEADRRLTAWAGRLTPAVFALLLLMPLPVRADMAESFDSWAETATWQSIETNGWQLTEAQVRGSPGGFGAPIGLRCAWLRDADDSTNSALRSALMPYGVRRLVVSLCRNTGMVGTNTAAIETSSDGTNWTARATVANASDAWQACTNDLNDPGTRYVRIRKTADTETGLLLGIDDFSLTDAAAVLCSNLVTVPEFPLVTDLVNIEVQATATPGVSNLTMQALYRFGLSGAFASIPMQLAYEDVYRTQIPISAGFAGTVQYYVEVSHNGPGVSPIWSPALGPAAPASYETIAGVADAGDRQLGPSSKATALTFTEMMVQPAARPDGRSMEFIELFNTDDVPVPLGGYRLTGDIGYVFPSNAVIPARRFMVVAADPAAIQDVYGLGGVCGPFTNSLPNGAGVVRLRNAQGAVLLEVAYDLNGDWPLAAAGGGHSMVLRQPDRGEGNPAAWGASSLPGGSPGCLDPVLSDPLSKVVINEFLAHTDLPEVDFIEIHNVGRTAVTLTGCTLSDSLASNRYTFASGTVLPAGGFLSRTSTDLGFLLSSHGNDVLILRNGSSGRILDAVRYAAQQNGVPTGRSPDGSPGWQELQASTPGATNAPMRTREIVINEIMFQPISGSDADEFVELYNRGTSSVDLSYWRFVEGISFTIPPGTVMAPGGYLVVAADTPHLLATFTNLTSANTVGNFSGRLANGGERIALAKPDNPALPFEDFVTVDEVTYSDSWAPWTDGGGSSLELIDPDADNRRKSNWAGSDESRKAPWTLISHTGTLENGNPGYTPAELHAMLLDAGVCLLDNIEVSVDGGANLLSNGKFDTGIGGWLIQGNHDASIHERVEGYQSAGSLRLVAQGDGDNSSNRAEIDLLGLTAGQSNVTIRARARWQAGHRQVLLRLLGNWLECVGTLDVPANLGTPGLANSRRVANAGPALWDLTHSPILPAAGSNVVVAVRACDPDGLSAITLRYRTDPSAIYSNVTMRDTGSGGDVLPGDGLFSATIPGQASGTTVAFCVQAVDGSGATNRAPAGAPNPEALVCFGQTPPPGGYGTYRFWITEATRTTWTAQPKQSNRLLPCTFVYNQWRADYDAQIRYRSSPFIRPTGDPLSVNSAYAFRMPGDARLLGSTTFNLDGLEFGRDDTYQRERTSFWLAGELGIPNCYQRYIQVYVNSVRKGKVFADDNHPSRAYLRTWFPDDPNGNLCEINDWFEFDDNFKYGYVGATIQAFTTTDGSLDRARYRWNWGRKVNRPVDDDASDIFALVEAMNQPLGDTYGKRVSALVDVDEWMRVFAVRHLVSDWDGYGYERGKNTYSYTPEQGPWRLLLWDLDYSLGTGSRDVTDSLFNINDPVLLTKFFTYPGTRRAYLRALKDAVDGPFQSAVAGPVLDAQFAAFNTNQVTVTAPSAVKTWIDARRAYVQGQLAGLPSPAFAITTPDGATNASPCTIAGTAPLAVATLMIDSNAVSVTWTSETAWRAPVTLVPGPQVITVAGLDRLGNVIGTDTVTLTSTRPAPPSPVGDVIINEIMYQAPFPGGNFVELYNRSTNTTHDLAGFCLNGADFTFPTASTIGPRQFLVIAENLASYGWHYGNSERVAGVYGGSLDNGGETLILLMPQGTNWVVVDSVRYDNAPPWPIAAAGGGQSLQLLDPDSDNSRPGNWIDAKVPVEAGWRFQSVTGVVLSDRSQVMAAARVQFYRSTAGTARVDDVSLVTGVVAEAGVNLLRNGGFESASSGWRPLGNHAGSGISSLAGHTGNSCYLVSATGAGVAGSHAVVTNYPLSAADVGKPFTLSFWTQDADAGGTLNARLDSSTVTNAVEIVPPPPTLVEPYTPGRANAVLATMPAMPLIWINEIMPANTNTFPDNAGEFDPWIELYNAGSTDIPLADYRLSNAYDNPTGWAFPTGGVIAAGERLLIWADGETNQTEGASLHANFRLNPTTGSVILSRVLADRVQILDTLDYASVDVGYSFGSYPEGDSTSRGVFHSPTPSGPNSPTSLPVTIRINEWMAKNTATRRDPTDGKYEDWFELFNPSGTPVHLAGFRLTDSPTDPTPFTVPLGIVIPARGFLLVWADSDAAVNGPGVDLHVDFGLSQIGEQIILLAPDGTVVDAVTFGPQAADTTEGRWPDGADIRVLAPPTPGASNRALFISSLPPAGSSGFTVNWAAASGTVYRFEASSNLVERDWQTLGIVTASDSVATFTDTNAAALPLRFYRITK